MKINNKKSNKIKIFKIKKNKPIYYLMMEIFHKLWKFIDSLFKKQLINMEKNHSNFNNSSKIPFNNYVVAQINLLFNKTINKVYKFYQPVKKLLDKKIIMKKFPNQDV